MPKRPNKNWTREEHILAFNLYCQIPFGSIHMRNPRVIELARLLGRSVGAISYKLSNFARLDPALKARGIRGLEHGAGGEEDVWREFVDHPESLAFESEQLRALRLGKSVEVVAEVDERDLPAKEKPMTPLPGSPALKASPCACRNNSPPTRCCCAGTRNEV